MCIRDRVRVLMDDLYTSGEDELLRGFAATPNVELRLFNPFPAGRGSLLARFGASLFDFNRVNRRMHNKLFIADGAMAVAGGRNIGNQSFRRTAGENFIDLDTFVTGALIPRLGVPLVATALDQAQDLYAGRLPERCAWVFGHEGQGVAASLLAAARLKVRIPHDMAAVESLNVGAAAAICLFEQRRQALAAASA